MCPGLLTALLLAVGAADQKPQQVQESVAVERVVITGHVIDKFANPIPGLTAYDFRLSVDGQETPIESVEWVPMPGYSEENPTVASTTTPLHPEKNPSVPADPRLTVFLFQWEIAGQKDVGFVRMMREAERFVENSDSRDRFAVFGFGSSLRLLQDLTTNHSAVKRAILKIRSLSWRGVLEEADGPTLSASVAGCGRVDSIEAGLECIGDSLQHLPGPKALIFLGWAAATTRDTWRVHHASIIEAIGKAEASVFALDVSNGRRYGKRVLLESLRTLAYETGGLYHETFDFPGLARQRVQRSLEGYYELVFRPKTQRGWHQVDIDLITRAGTPLFRRWYRD